METLSESITRVISEPADTKIYNMFKDKLGDYFYVRDIGGGHKLKVALGTPNTHIT